MIGDNNCETGEGGSEEDAHVTDVDSDVKEVEKVIEQR